MKKFQKVMIITAAALLLAGCGAGKVIEKPAEIQYEEQETVEKEEISEENEGPKEEVANPWRDCTEDEALDSCPRLFKAPDGAEDITWKMMEKTGEDKGPLVELDFSLDGMDFCARAMYGADENEDIHGLYYEWDAEDDATLSGWGEGNMQAKCYRAIEDDGYVDLITWYDIEIGIAYSLSVAAPDLDGFDIQAVAEQMFASSRIVYGDGEVEENADEHAEENTEENTEVSAKVSEEEDAIEGSVDLKDYLDAWIMDMGGDLEQQLAEKLGSKVQVSEMGDSNVICDGAIEFYGAANGTGYMVWQYSPVEGFSIYGITVGMNAQKAVETLKEQGLIEHSDGYTVYYSTDPNVYYIQIDSDGDLVSKVTYVRCTKEKTAADFEN